MDLAGGAGAFSINPMVEINLEASFKCFGLTLEFGSNHPAEMTFHACRDGELVEDYIVTGLSATTVISHELTKTPKGTQLAKVRELQVIRTIYSGRQPVHLLF